MSTSKKTQEYVLPIDSVSSISRMNLIELSQTLWDLGRRIHDLRHESDGPLCSYASAIAECAIRLDELSELQ